MLEACHFLLMLPLVSSMYKRIGTIRTGLPCEFPFIGCGMRYELHSCEIILLLAAGYTSPLSCLTISLQFAVLDSTQ